MRILVTGSEGVLGQHLVKRLYRWCKDSGNLNNVVTTLDIKGNPDVFCDVTDVKMFGKVYSRYKPDVVLHLAAKTDPVSSFYDEEDLITNVNGTRNILECMKERQGLIMFFSSCAVYGNGTGLLNENAEKKPTSPYGVDKLAAEMYIRLYQRFGIDHTIFRLGNVYSEYDSHYLMWLLYRALVEKKQFKIYGHGKMIRDFVYIGDLSNQICSMLDEYEKENGNWMSDVYNIGHEPLEVMSVINKFMDKYGQLGLDYLPGRIGEFDAMYLDTSKIETVWGWKPKTKLLEDGMDKLVEEFKMR